MARSLSEADPCRAADAAPAMPRAISPGLPYGDWIAGYHLGCHLLVASQRLAQSTGLDLLSLHILGEVAVGASQRAIQTLRLGQPPAPLVPISSRKVALVTGLPRETVRRRIGKLVEAGYLRKVPDGLLPTDRLPEEWMQVAVRESVERHARLTNQLIETGLLVLAEG